MEKFYAYAKLLRLPGLGGLAIPPVFGAISVGIYDFFHLSILFVIGAFATIFGFVLNDYADVELDSLVEELREKPLVKGIIPRKNAVAIVVISIILLFFFIAFLWRDAIINEIRFAAIVVMTIAGILGTIYNLYGKKIAGSDFMVALSMAFLFLFGALSFSKPNLLAWIIFLLTFNQTLHMNAVEGGIKDADHDFVMGVKNIALVSGVKVENWRIRIPWHFKLFGLSIRLFSSILIFIPFIYGLQYQVWQLALILFLIFIVLYLEAMLISMKRFDRKKIRKIISMAAFSRYSIVPIMLVSKIGMIGIFLAFFPIIWYLTFAPISGIKLFQPEM